ncbi:MAG: hypothetical protein JWN64_10 [Parcubacteria group bacterium]|nr:hypothetical protein [Parcubacteria group bacterium]
MKALFVSNDPTVFDPASPTRLRMKEYAQAIGELYIISPAHTKVEIHEGNLHLFGIKAMKLFAPGAVARKARQLVQTMGIDVVSAQDPFEYGMAALKAVRGTAVKLHIQVHTDFLSPWFVHAGGFRSRKVPMPYLNRIRRHMAKRVLMKANGIRAVSKRVADSLVSKYGNRIPVPSVIPISVPATLPIAVPLPPLPFTFVFITVGRLEAEKRIEDIIDALARIAPLYPSIGLVVVGDGRERHKLEHLAQALHIKDRVVFLGWRNDSLGIIRSAHAYIQASAYEGYGRTLIEAALARIPIITTDVGIVGEVFNGYEDVLSAPPADPAALSVQMRGILEDSAARISMVMNAERKARAHLAENTNQAVRIAADLAQAYSKV